MIVSKVLLKDLITNHLKQENGLNEVLQITLNAMMKNERSLHLQQASGNKANGYRPGIVYGHGKLLELRVMSYNIAAGFGDIYGIAEVIAEQQPDLVALQEVDVHWGGELRSCPMPTEAFTSRQSRRNLPI